jgi:glycosyltransferase involved in cell wall biosynthesis
MVIFPLRGSGSGVYTDNLSRQLTRRGHAVKALCVDHSPPRDRPYPVEALLFNNGQNSGYDLDFNFPAFTSHPLSPARTFGNLTGAEKQAYRQAFRDRIAREVAAFQPDLVHAHHGWVIASVLAELRAPYVVTLHGTEHYGFQHYPDYRDWALTGLRGARLVMALMDEERDKAVRTYGLDPARVVVVRPGVDTALFRPVTLERDAALRQYGIERGGRPVVLCGSKLTAIKGTEIILEAARRYAQMAEEPITLIAGEGDQRPALEALARELNLRDVHFLGHQTHAQMVSLYNLADVLAFPSTTDWFPLVVMESLACGTPVVASRVGGLPEIVAEGLGYLVEPGDAQALAEKAAQAIRERLKEKAGAAAAAHIREHFDLERMAARVEQVYHAALARPG